MSETQATPNGAAPAQSLPPVEPPSATLILRLFLVPGILVILIVVLVVLVLRSVGGGPRTPGEFVAALGGRNDTGKWKAAQDLAQVLPRSEDMRCDANFALELCAILEREMRKAPPEDRPVNKYNPFASARDKGFLEPQGELVEFLPKVVGNFHVPVAVPLLEQLIRESHDKVDQPAYRYRLWNATVALSLLGARMKEYDALPSEKKRAIRDTLEAAAGAAPGPEAWATQACQLLDARTNPELESASPVVAHLNETLALAARYPDELARKYAVLALSGWYGPGAEPLLVQLSYDHGDIPDERFEMADEKVLTPQEKARRIKEIRFNAALVLARNGSQRTPWELVGEALNENGLATLYADNPGMASLVTLKALRDLRQLRKTKPDVFERQTALVGTVTALAEASPNVAVKVEAARVLRGEDASAIPLPRTSREVLMIVGIGVAVVLLLVLAVFARWKRVASRPTTVA